MIAPSKDSSGPLKKEESGGKGRKLELEYPENYQFLN